MRTTIVAIRPALVEAIATGEIAYKRLAPTTMYVLFENLLRKL
ncbi:unannotated protein [freshwater metagenome]|uniref:Unannotated protein n=1 Tax=freshwater metagenome TaxID=449393 RepID=A0A6J6W6J4_9ZZZZ